MKLRPFICTIGLLLVISSCSYAQNKVQIAKKVVQALVESNEKSAPFAVENGTKIAREALSREGAAAVRGAVTTAGVNAVSQGVTSASFKQRTAVPGGEVTTKTVKPLSTRRLKTPAQGAEKPAGKVQAKAEELSPYDKMLQAAQTGDYKTFSQLLESGVEPPSIEAARALMQAALPHPEVIYDLFYWWQRCVVCGVDGPTLEFALPEARLFWIRQAVKEGYSDTVLTLVRHFISSNGFETDLLIKEAVENGQFKLAEDLMYGTSHNADGALDVFLNYSPDALTEEKLTWFFDHTSDQSFYAKAFEVERYRIMLYTPQTGNTWPPQVTPPEINVDLQNQVFAAFKKDPSLPDRFGMAPVEFAKKCYESPGVTEPGKITNGFYQMLLDQGIVRL